MSSPKRTCAFCESSANLTGEHVFGAWLGRLDLPQEPSPHRAGPLNRSPREMGVTKPFNQTVRNICASCNNGWMSNLEAVAARALSPLILGSGDEIASHDRPLIAAWAQKTALVSMLVSSKEDRAGGYGLPATEYGALFKISNSGTPLPDTKVWVARYNGDRIRTSVCVTPVVIRPEGASSPQLPQGYLATIIVGKLLLHFVRFTTPRLAIETAVRDELSELWPKMEGAFRLASIGIEDAQITKLEKGAAIHSLLPGIVVDRWRPATDLPRSAVYGSMVKMPMPCGKHSIFYPLSLAEVARHGIFHAFSTSCECGKGYLVVTEEDGAHVKIEGKAETVAEVYESTPGEEGSIVDDNGVFWCKRLFGPWAMPKF